jgi:hypothetical protein
MPLSQLKKKAWMPAPRAGMTVKLNSLCLLGPKLECFRSARQHLCPGCTLVEPKPLVPMQG